MLLTDVDGVYVGLGHTAPASASGALAASSCGRSACSGSMGPKVDAVCRFVEAGGRFAAIGSLSQAAMILDGQAGTIVRHHEG